MEASCQTTVVPSTVDFEKRAIQTISSQFNIPLFPLKNDDGGDFVSLYMAKPLQETADMICKTLSQDASSMEPMYWHSEDQHGIRETMRDCIKGLIKQRRKVYSNDWLLKLNEVVSIIERSLYFSASAFHEYTDPCSLINRLNILMQSYLLDYQLKNSNLSITIPKKMEDCLLSSIIETSFTIQTHEVAQPSIELSNSNNDAIEIKFPQKQVSSQGCSKVFIVKVLYSVSEFVKGKSLPSILTFNRDLIMQWLGSAKQACTKSTYLDEESFYGGPPFYEQDESTYWTEPHQLFTWWKNNVERRSKFRVIQNDALYVGKEPRRIARANWCQAVVYLTDTIRAYSGSTNILRSDRLSSGIQNKGSPDARDLIRVKKQFHKPAISAAPASINSDKINNGIPAFSLYFPLKIYDILELLVNEDHSGHQFFSWIQDGKAFQISDTAKFTTNVLFKYFKHSNFKSFQRQLNLYGFRRSVLCGRGIYFHQNFRRGDRDSVQRIRRVSSNSVENLDFSASVNEFSEHEVSSPQQSPRVQKKTNVTDTIKEKSKGKIDMDSEFEFYTKIARYPPNRKGTRSSSLFTNHPQETEAEVVSGKKNKPSKKRKQVDISTEIDDANFNEDEMLEPEDTFEYRESRVGKKFQAIVPEVISCLDKASISATECDLQRANILHEVEIDFLDEIVLRSFTESLIPSSIVVCKLIEGNKTFYRLCCITQISDVKDCALVFDGVRDNIQVQIADILEDCSRHYESWTYGHIAMVCRSAMRYGDNIYKIWQSISKNKSLREVLDLYIRIYPHAKQCKAGFRRIIDIFDKSKRVLKPAIISNENPSSEGSSNVSDESSVEKVNATNENDDDEDDDIDDLGSLEDMENQYSKTEFEGREFDISSDDDNDVESISSTAIQEKDE